MTLLFSSDNILVSVKIFFLFRQKILFTKLCMLKVRCINQDENGEQTIARVNAIAWV